MPHVAEDRVLTACFRAITLGVIGLVGGLPGLAQVPAGNTSPPAPSGNTSSQAPTASLGALLRKSPPQPQQKQSLDYFVGRWDVTWSGRESTLSLGPRTGTITYTRLGGSAFVDVQGEGKTEDGRAYKETGTLGWHEGQKILALTERLASGVDVLSIGDWTSPITIRFESAPIAAGTKPVPSPPSRSGQPAQSGQPGQTVTLRRLYSIVSAQAFTVTEEISIDGGPFTRLGRGVVSKVTN
jgi:hypothetical protein